jgi:hypothetical protein
LLRDLKCSDTEDIHDKYKQRKIYGDKIQGDQKVPMYLMITVQKHAKIFLNSFKHLPWESS